MNRKDRISKTLPARAVDEFALAAEYAHSIGCPLNRFITINLDRAGISSDSVDRFRTIFTSRARDWLRYRRSVLHYIYVVENKTALNMHLVMHVPPHLFAGFARRQRTWMKEAGAECMPEKTIRTRPVRHRDAYPFELDGVYMANLENVVSYMLKGAAPDVCWRYSIEHQPQGKVVGKRAGVSEGIGPTARARAAWSPWSPTRRLVLPCAAD